MKLDAKIREDVIRQLQWDVQVPDPDAIGVAVKDGAVTLTGHVTTFAQKLAAARAAERVHGVKVIADELNVHQPGERDDQDIARAIAHVLASNVHLPPGKVHAQVKNRRVTLEGEVDHPHQRSEVERMTRNVGGVTAIANTIRVKTPPPPLPPTPPPPPPPHR